MTENFESYLATVEARLTQQGFKPLPEGKVTLGADAVYRRRRFSITKFGVEDTFCVVKWMPDLTSGGLESFSGQVFEFGAKNKFFLPRGIFATFITHALLVTEGLSEDVYRFVTTTYCPKHWSSFEFPAVLDLSTKRLYFYESTPPWGGAYYRGFRKEIQESFDPA